MEQYRHNNGSRSYRRIYNFEGFTSDGQFIYAVNESSSIYKIDPVTWTATTITISIGVSPVGIAYDAVNNGFWLIEYEGTTAYLVSMTGSATGQTLTDGYEASGIAYDDVTIGGPYLWVADVLTPELHRWNITTGIFEESVHAVTDVPDVTPYDNMAGLGIGMDTRLGKVVLLGVTESYYFNTNYIFGYELGEDTPPDDPCNPVITPSVSFANDCSSATISWTAPAGSNLKYKISRNDTVLATDLTATTYTETFNFVNGAQYTWEIITKCTNSESVPATATGTAACGIGIKTNSIADVSIFPNPATSSVNVKGIDIVKIEVYNAMGQMIDSKTGTGNETIVDVFSYEKGTYFFKAYDANAGTVVKRIVVGN